MENLPSISVMSKSPVRVYRNSGFSLFELVVFIISVAIIYAAAARRFADFPGEAERANFFAVTTQIQSGVNLESMLGITRGTAGQMQYYQNANPMDLLLDPPSNYIGAYDYVDVNALDRRVWYFDLTNGELVYLVNDNTNLYLVIGGQRVLADELRFELTVNYRYQDRETGLPIELSDDSEANADLSLYRRSYGGLLLKPVIPFEWDTNVLELAGTAITGP